MTATSDIVQRLWNLCHVLRDDGITYHEYVIELTHLLFLKMARETQREEQIPEGFRWEDLRERKGTEQLKFYKKLLVHLGTKAKGIVREIYSESSTSLRSPRNLKRLVEAIDSIDWYDAGLERFGDLYEGLLEKSAGEKKSGAGQYFTPRALIDAMVNLLKPCKGEIIQDPAAGTGGFLVSSDRFIKENTRTLADLSAKERDFQIFRAFWGVELVPDTHRLGLMNLMLHGIEGNFLLGDALSAVGLELPPADVILTNPPFGTKKGGGPPDRGDFEYQTSNKQFAFLQHAYNGLTQGGRAAVVVPDNVLFEENSGSEIREDLMKKANLHTILRLPVGIFYALGVKTNVLFFARDHRRGRGTREIWIYDMRTGLQAFGRRNHLRRDHFAPFEEAFGDDPYGRARRRDQGERGRFKKFDLREIEKRGNNLDITWLKDRESSASGVLSPVDIAAEIADRLRFSLAQIQEIEDLFLGAEAEQ